MCPTPAEKTTEKSVWWSSGLFAQVREDRERQTHRQTLAMVVALVRSFWLSGTAMFYFSPLTTWEDCLTPCVIVGRFLCTAAFKHCVALARDSRQLNIRMRSTPTSAADPISGHIIYRALVEMKRQQLIDALQKRNRLGKIFGTQTNTASIYDWIERSGTDCCPFKVITNRTDRAGGISTWCHHLFCCCCPCFIWQIGEKQHIYCREREREKKP